MNEADERALKIEKHRKRLKDLEYATSTQLSEIAEKYPDEVIVKLEDYLSTLRLDGEPLTLNKVKVLLHLMNKNKIFDEDGAEKIIAFINHCDYGWKRGNYAINNHCLRSSRNHCREAVSIKTEEALEDAFIPIRNIFLHEEYGGVTLLLFNYCLAALFNSILGSDHLRIPFYLQIACEKNTGLYSLIQEILTICDVNSGLVENCCDPFHHYGSCDYQCIHYYPTQFVEKDLNRLAYNRDVPIIIDGHENDRYYNTLLREIVNIPNRRQPLEMRDRFNLIPIFICPAIESTYDNVISLNFTEMSVSRDYLNLIKENKQMLASWVFQLVKNAAESFFPHYKDDPQEEAVRDKKRHFAYKVTRNRNRIKEKYADITPNDAMNVGLLSFFFDAYMNVFRNQITLHFDKAYVHTDAGKKIEGSKAIDLLVNFSEKSLVRLHKAYSPIPLESILINTMDAKSKKAERRNVEAVRIAKRILKYYARYRVLFRITNIEVKEDRFIYDVQLTAGTEYEHIFRRAGNIQILLNYEHFIPIKEGSSIKIMASDKLVHTDSLTRILTSDEFNDGKLKIPYALGHDEKGDARIVDIAEFPHLLISGITGSGKSSALECLLMSIAYKHRSGDVYIMALDLGKSSMYLFDKLDILLSPIVNDTDEGLSAILKLKAEMEYRYALLRVNRNALTKQPSIVCVIDEFHHLITDIDDKEEIKALDNALSGLIKRGRSTKIHMIFATQEPRKEYIRFGGVSNTASRIGLLCSDRYESMAAIGKPGAESLVGKGAMLVKLPNNGIMYRNIQGAYMPENDIKKLLQEIKFDIPNKYRLGGNESGIDKSQTTNSMVAVANAQDISIDIYDELLAEAIIWVLGQETAANSDIKSLGVGYDKAKVIMEKLEQFDLITKQDARKPRNPRQVKSKSLDELLQISELMDVLTRNGFSEADMSKALHKRIANRPVASEGQEMQ